MHIVKTFAKAVGATITGTVVGYYATRAGMGSYALEGTGKAIVTGALTWTAMTGMAGGIAATSRSLSIKLGVIAGIAFGTLYAADSLMGQTLTTARMNDTSQAARFKFQGKCGDAGVVQGPELFRPENCAFK